MLHFAPAKSIMCSHLSSWLSEWFNKEENEIEIAGKFIWGLKKVDGHEDENKFSSYVTFLQWHKIIKHTNARTEKSENFHSNPKLNCTIFDIVKFVHWSTRYKWTWTNSTRKESEKFPIFQVSYSCFLTFWHIKIEWSQTQRSEATKTWNRFQLCLH